MLFWVGQEPLMLCLFQACWDNVLSMILGNNSFFFILQATV